MLLREPPDLEACFQPDNPGSDDLMQEVAEVIDTHNLFADLLNSTLRQRRSAEDIRELHRRASRWHQGEGSLEEAMSHAMAALAAYPELSCTGGPFQVRSTWGICRDVFCAGKEGSFELLHDVLQEVFELFAKRLHEGDLVHDS